MIGIIGITFLVLLDVALIALTCVLIFARKAANKNFKATLDKLERELITTTSECELVKDALFKTHHQKKSSEVRLGKIGENLAPFTEGWPWDSNNFRFIGSPIDGIQFTDEEIIFVEIKTGKARLSKYQTLCKKLVSEGKVSFASFRIGENGISLEKD